MKRIRSTGFAALVAASLLVACTNQDKASTEAAVNTQRADLDSLRSGDEDIVIRQVEYTSSDGRSYRAILATREALLEAGVGERCRCGDEFCVNGYRWRCMYAGGGEYRWFETNEVWGNE